MCGRRVGAEFDAALFRTVDGHGVRPEGASSGATSALAMKKRDAALDAAPVSQGCGWEGARRGHRRAGPARMMSAAVPSHAGR